MIKIIFPWIHSGKANKKVNDKINEISQGHLDSNFDYMKGYKDIKLQEAEEFFEKTLDVKKSLEDKLKTSLFSVTFGITVLTSAISLLFNDGISSLDTTYKGVIFLAGSIAVIYMMLAGIFAIKTISGYIAVYQLFPEDISNVSEDNKKKSVAICAELNSLSNIIRQNLMNVSFHCIINSLFVMMIFFFLVGTGSFIGNKHAGNPSKVEVVVQPNKDSIDSLDSKIVEYNIHSTSRLDSLQKEISTNTKITSQINSRIEKIEKNVETNRSEIERRMKKQEKSSNNKLHTDVDSATLHPRR